MWEERCSLSTGNPTRAIRPVEGVAAGDDDPSNDDDDDDGDSDILVRRGDLKAFVWGWLKAMLRVSAREKRRRRRRKREEEERITAAKPRVRVALCIIDISLSNP
uniref:Uncharacterized protein n=1 Tax=Lotharella globosa TaxID=91324 RepID=A0A7S4DKV6_9EUKA|mmetsp:Transcript_20554/g.41462  ORF Transcript_20554/g.41462 Transcript_20554/m.41462 type:complete len:105 (+) Transcript_20554:1860-2174(+)